MGWLLGFSIVLNIILFVAMKVAWKKKRAAEAQVTALKNVISAVREGLG